MPRSMRGRVLIAAGSDSGGGAGIQADIKAVTALGGYAMTAVTALTAQNTKGVFGVHPVPIPFLRQQLDLLFDDLGADVIKTGMLHSGPVIDTIVDVIEEKAMHVPLVVDPVMVAKGGHSLLDPDAMQVLKARLILRAHLLTPNLPEAELLTGMTIKDVDDMHHAAEMLLSLGPPAVLLKGGHLSSDTVVDLLATEDGVRAFKSPRIAGTSTHGTGCTLASAIATGLAQGLAVEKAVERARKYVTTAIATAPGYGAGHGPLNHVHTVKESA
ncbi:MULTISPECIES: bifunctional hydroxymethylpyrimidine kinase/phosphomethylpyrimidine kinase [Thalassobaculum]|uniref:hydroxymethylpyrimidine kinase n=1 Tax=Thalassobaculum litoreum DSM 18839 TaxID=1123362 RepID=A0A8G2EX32_9PROT|nr:hydroxymethylpyrimidine/phosphomethylpyrimidine kinase [Thalassobaculum litoreum DSM 18839]